MRLRRKWDIVPAVTVLALIAGWSAYVHTDSFVGRKLVAELGHTSRTSTALTTEQRLIFAAAMTRPRARTYAQVSHDLIALGRPAIPLLIAHLQRNDPLACDCDEVLSSMGTVAAGPLAEVVQGDPSRRWHAVRALLRMSPPAAEAAPALLSALQDGDAWTRSMAAVALARIDAALATRMALPVVSKDIQDPDLGVQFLATWALCEIGPVSPEAQDAIEKAKGGKYWAEMSKSHSLNAPRLRPTSPQG